MSATAAVYAVLALCLADAAVGQGLQPACQKDLECCNANQRLPIKTTCYADLFKVGWF